MPFPITDFTAVEDSKYFKYSVEDASISKQTDGGIYVSRRRYTRNAPVDIETGFTAISDSDFNLLTQFYQSVGGGAQSWVYTHPISGEQLNVVFSASFGGDYAGMGMAKLWNVESIKLRTIY